MKKPELLAPAGNPEIALCAARFGADADLRTAAVQDLARRRFRNPGQIRDIR